MDNTITLGRNLTGTQISPLNATVMQDYAQAHAADAPADEGQLEQMHRDYMAQAEAVGSVPVPGTLKGAFKTATAKMSGTRPEVLVDKLGERLAFERAGTRLYEAMLMKISGVAPAATTDALGSDGNPQGPGSRVDALSLQRLRSDEQAHMHLVRQALQEMGADATAMTPCADMVGVLAQGVMQTLSDPRTTVAQCLNALLTAELSDHAGWELLMELAEDLGYGDMAVRFSVAATTEAEHLSLVKQWLRTEVLSQAR